MKYSQDQLELLIMIWYDMRYVHHHRLNSGLRKFALDAQTSVVSCLYTSFPGDRFRRLSSAAPTEPELSALNAAFFAHVLFSTLRLPAVAFTEAFAMANHILRAHGCADTGAKRTPIHPVLDSVEPPELPGTKPQPIPHIEGVDLSLGFSRSIPGMLSSLRANAS
jgi:hypothetical protein